MIEIKLKTKCAFIKQENIMKILRITAQGLPLFKETLDLKFYAQQRVADKDKDNLYHLFSNVYLNPTSSFIGINASGKTSILKVLRFVLGMISNEPINHLSTKQILGNTNKIVFNTYFFCEERNAIGRLETVITSKVTKTEGLIYQIVSERLWTKGVEEVSTRKGMLEFNDKQLILVRDGKDDFLSDDVSIMIAYNKKTGTRMSVVDLLVFTNLNILPDFTDIPLEVIYFLDPTIESIQFEKISEKSIIQLKFREKQEILLNNIVEIEHYLSSGTIKGIVTFTMARKILREGGYLVIDEIENHFNKEIVSTLIRFFKDSQLNKKGGVLFFSTHYPELMDEYDRNDSIFITRNNNGITVENLCTILKRNDIKKSEAYESGYLQGTTPSYEAYMNLKKSMSK